MLGSGSSNGSSLLASGPLKNKLFFYVGNVAGRFTSTDVKKHLIEKIKVNSDFLTCFPVTRNVNKSFQEAGRNALVEPNEEPTRFPKAFRVCISARDKHKFLNMNLWPKDVLIRTWIFKKKERTERKNDGHSVDVISETVIVRDSHLNYSTNEQTDDSVNNDG